MKTVIKILESKNIEICDKIYENISVAQKELTYKHYIHKECAITLSESKSFVSEGTTGLCTWEASIALANWFLQSNNQDLIEGKTILEIGAGTGLCGLSLVKFGNPAKVILTDGSHSVMKNLKLNIAINFENRENIEEKLLPWENIQIIQIESVDLIIAADVVYDISVFDDLTNTISAIFKASAKKCELFLASTIRNELTYEKFKKYLQNYGFIIEVCSIEKNEKFLFWNADTTIEILKISLANQ